MGTLASDLHVNERRRQERDLAFVLYTQPMLWEYQYKEGAPIYKYESPEVRAVIDELVVATSAFIVLVVGFALFAVI